MIRIGIIGSGIAGLTAATMLSDFPIAEVTVFEANERFGGRANVTAQGEHCPRLVLEDYEHFLRLLSGIPAANGKDLRSCLEPVRRLAFTRSHGWVEISHLYSLFSREIPIREKLRPRLSQLGILVAEQQVLMNANTFASRRNYSIATLLRMFRNLVVSRRVLAFPGPTDTCLIDPWVRHLEHRGVGLRSAAPVRSIMPLGGRVHLEFEEHQEVFDAVIVATYIPDTIALLHASRIHNSFPNLVHTHCKAATIELDPRENVLKAGSPALYCRGGVNILLQPEAARCVVLCTKSASTDDNFILAAARNHLGLEYEVVSYAARENSAENESVYVADYVRLDRALPKRPHQLYFAGSYLHNSYPLDSAEAAVRTAMAACREVTEDLGLRLFDMQWVADPRSASRWNLPELPGLDLSGSNHHVQANP